MVDADRRLDRRSARRSERRRTHGRLWWHHGWHRLGLECLCRDVDNALCRGSHRRHRRRRRLRHLRRPGREMVPGQARPRGRSDRRRLRRRRRADRHPDQLCHRAQRLRSCLLLVRLGAGRRRVRAGLVPALAGSGEMAGVPARRSRSRRAASRRTKCSPLRCSGCSTSCS